MFHKHIWQVVEKTHTEPVPNMNLNCSEYMAERLVMGVTTILFQCPYCYGFRREEMLGKR